MAALTKDRNTKERAGVDFVDPVAAGKTIHAGALVVLNATGYAEPGSTATGLTARGRAEDAADNASGADGDISVRVKKGVFLFANHGADAVDRTHIGSTCYIVDDQTVAATDGTGTRSAAGTVMDVDADGVWVKID